MDINRQQIQDLIVNGSIQQANLKLRQLFARQPDVKTANYTVNRFKEISKQLDFKPMKIAVLRSFTIEPMIPLLHARLFSTGIDASFFTGNYNTYNQEILDTDSSLYKFEPDIIILAINSRDVIPSLWEQFPDLLEEDIEKIINGTISQITNLIEVFTSHSNASLIIQGLETPGFPAMGILDTCCQTGQIDAIQHINRGLRRLASKHSAVYYLDYDHLIHRYGFTHWEDRKKWNTIRLPVSGDHLIHLADEYMKYLHPLSGRVAKALVVDLDNTLWGGVIGEDGMTGIQLGLEYPGYFFLNLQRKILDLYQRGVILAICSKNNEADALEIIEKHPHMLLRQKHFAAMRINWEDKASNLKQIAAELNIGVDALAFLDDNPIEREWVQTQLPEVHIVELSKDISQYAQILQECPVFERLSLSGEDKERGRYYAEQRQRKDLEKEANSVEEFLYSLQIHADVEEINPMSSARIAQLTQKTNQFNLTTRRYTEQDITAIAEKKGSRIYSIRVTDRFGDNGITGVAITHIQADICEIDTFLLSCRVIGRAIETALLACIEKQARNDGAKRLVGWYIPTKKNLPAKDFFSRHGFSQTALEDQSSKWELDITSQQNTIPLWIDCDFIDQAA